MTHTFRGVHCGLESRHNLFGDTWYLTIGIQYWTLVNLEISQTVAHAMLTREQDIEDILVADARKERLRRDRGV